MRVERCWASRYGRNWFAGAVKWIKFPVQILYCWNNCCLVFGGIFLSAYYTTCGPYFGTKFEGAYFFICCTDWNDSTYRKQTKYSAFVFLPDKQTSGCVYKTFYPNRWKWQTYPVSYSFHALTSQNVGRNATSSSPFIKTFSNCYFVGQISLLQRKQHHFKFHLTWARGAQFSKGPVLTVHLSESVSPICSERAVVATCLFHRSGLKHYSTIRLLTLRVKSDRISWRTPKLEHLPWTAFIRCIWNILFPIKAPFAKKMILFWSLHFLSVCIFSMLRDTLELILWKKAESYFHLTMSKWPISTAKL